MTSAIYLSQNDPSFFSTQLMLHVLTADQKDCYKASYGVRSQKIDHWPLLRDSDREAQMHNGYHDASLFPTTTVAECSCTGKSQTCDSLRIA
jgi:hypothetical protein